MIYELRTYQLHIGKVPSYLKLFETVGYEILSSYARPMGFFFNETGLQNCIHHIWAYEDRAQRAEGRAKLYKDANWMQKFIPYALPHLVEQRTAIFELQDGSPDPLANVGDGTQRLFEMTDSFGAAEVPQPTDNTVMILRATTGDLSRRVHLQAFADEADRSAKLILPDVPAGGHVTTDTLHPTVFSAVR